MLNSLRTLLKYLSIDILVKFLLNIFFVVKFRPESCHSQHFFSQLAVLGHVLHVPLLHVPEESPRQAGDGGLRGGPDDSLSSSLCRLTDQPEGGPGDQVAGDGLVHAHVSHDVGGALAREHLQQQSI